MIFIALMGFLRDRRRSLIAWTLAIVTLVIAMALFYPSIKDAGADFDAYFESLPESVQETFGTAGGNFTSPEGYLISQLYSNMYPLVLLILGISMAAWAIAGDEAEGTLEVTLAAPLRRNTLAWARWLATAIATLGIALVSTAALVAVSPALGLDEGFPPWGPWSAMVSMWALILLYASVAFAVGAATGRRAWAIGVAAALATIGFLGQLFASLAEPLEYLRPASPWYWFLGSSPLTEPPGLVSFALPVAIAVALTAAGVGRFTRRDVGT